MKKILQLFTTVIASRVLFTKRRNPKGLSGLRRFVKSTRLAMTVVNSCKIFISVLICFFIVACGQSGKLYLPPNEANQNHDTKN